MCDNRDRNSKPPLLLQNFKAETFSRIRVKNTGRRRSQNTWYSAIREITEENTMGTAKPTGVSLVE
jgi:hypothetical protein